MHNVSFALQTSELLHFFFQGFYLHFYLATFRKIPVLKKTKEADSANVTSIRNFMPA